MNGKVQALSIVGLASIIVATSLAVARLSGEQSAVVAGDFRNASVAEVHDGQGNVVLRGSFAPVESDDEGEIERVARLTATSGQTTPAGEAEVEYQTDAPQEQEVEFTLTGLSEGNDVALVIDGQRVGTAKPDRRGRVSIEFAVKTGQ